MKLWDCETWEFNFYEPSDTVYYELQVSFNVKTFSMKLMTAKTFTKSKS